MSDIQEKLKARIAASQALLKTAGEGESVEKAKDPEALIGNAADVDVTENKPEGVEIPGEKGLSADGETTPCRGTDIGHVEVNGPEVSCNEEVDDIIESAKKIEKAASALIERASQILAIPDAAFAGVTKTASAEITAEDVERYIVKRASEGDAVAQGMLNYAAMMQKVAAGIPAEDVVAGAEIEANIADATEQVASKLLEENPELGEEQAREIAEESVAQVLNGAMKEDEVAVEEGEKAEEGADLEAQAEELIDAVKENIRKDVPEISEEDAEALAVKAVADVLEGGDGVLKEASAEEPAEPVAEAAEKVEEAEAPAEGAEVGAEAAEIVAQVAEAIQAEDPSISDEDAVKGAVAALQSAAQEDGEAPAAENEVGALAAELVSGLADEIKAQDPSISDEEALDGAADAVADAFENVSAEQAIGAVDEAGAPVVDDTTAQAIVDELDKTASANPLREHLSEAIYGALKLSPEAFKARLA